MNVEDLVVSKLPLPAADAPLAAELLALNLRSRRPSPFFTPEYMRTYLRHNELYRPGEAHPFLLAVRRRASGALVGVLPLKRVLDRSFKVPFFRIEFLVSSEIDLPTVLAAPDDELPVARALLRALSRSLNGASTVDLIHQPEDSPLFQAREWAQAPWADVRDSASMPISSIRLAYASSADYFQALSHKMRSNVSRLARRLFAEGPLEYMTSTDPAVLPDFFAVYLDVEERSWKQGKDASLRRHPARVAMYEALLSREGSARTHVDLLVLRGEPIAAQVSFELGPTLFAMETCYDERYGEVGPGNLMLFLAVAGAIRLGAREMSLHGHFEYYKHRWLGATLETRDIRILRLGSVPHVRAVAGSTLRRLLGQEQRAVGVPEGHAAYARDGASRPTATKPSPRALQIVERARLHPGVTRYDAAALATLMPFPTMYASPAARLRS